MVDISIYEMHLLDDDFPSIDGSDFNRIGSLDRVNRSDLSDTCKLSHSHLQYLTHKVTITDWSVFVKL